jgi:hypothetical protein
MPWRRGGCPVAGEVLRSKFRASLLLDELGQSIDCSSVSISFGINRIPTAVCTVASGVVASNPGLASRIHAIASELVTTTPAAIMFSPEGDFDAKHPGPQEESIFHGYVSGISFKRTLTTAIPVIYLVHWLSDLAFSSAISESSNPANPARFRWSSTPPGANEGAATSLDEFIATHIPEDVVQPTNMIGAAGDLWGKVLQQVFAGMAKKDVLSDFGEDRCVSLGSSNNTIKDALARIETHKRAGIEISGDENEGAGSPYHVPLRLVSDSNSVLVAEGISHHLHQITVNNLFNSSVWDKLVELSAAYYFCIVPRVHTAIMAPFIPGLRVSSGDKKKKYIKDIEFSDIVDWTSSFNSIRPIRAVGILPGDMKDMSGIGLVSPLNKLGGCYSPLGPDGKERPGMVIFRLPPPWLDVCPLLANDPDIVTNNPSSAMTPQNPTPRTDAEKAKERDKPRSATEAINNMGDYYTNCAKATFAEEMLRGRSAVISGKLRFDIAPGTTVLIKNVPPKFIEEDQLSFNLVGSVAGVGIVLDAENAVACTSFQLDHIRTESKTSRTERLSNTTPCTWIITTGLL